MESSSADCGKLLYDWPNNGCEDSLHFRDVSQLSHSAYDVVIVGAGVVGCALAYKLTQFQLRILLIEKKYDVGEGSSKGNSAIVHTGFDAVPASLESTLVTTASREWPDLAEKLKIPYDRCGALLLAVNEEQNSQLSKIHKKSMENGVDDAQLITATEARQIEPSITGDNCGGMVVPGEAIGDPFTTPIAFAEVAITNGADLLFGTSIIAIEDAEKTLKTLVTANGHRIRSRIIVNAAGLGGQKLAGQYGGAAFDVNPRRGQFLIFDHSSRSLIKRVLLPVPTAHSKGILVIPTVFGNILVGPTAEDFHIDDQDVHNTTEKGLDLIFRQTSQIVPELKSQPVIGAYAGVRCNCSQGNYLIRYNDGHKGFLTITGIRSTGFTSCPALADYIIEGLAKHCQLSLANSSTATDSRPKASWPGWWQKPFLNNDRYRSDYGRIVCFCENISRGEIVDALDSPLKPRTLDAIKRRTRAQMGRCQGFDCQMHIAEIISQHCGIAISQVCKNSPESTLVTS
ncbi:NAD(P)/FAD-dependent oxidoreductase [bacterium]|nr:NAD(P)/FAD-dependent oxidoreductase [bacterium]